MRALQIHLMNRDGDVLESFVVDEFTIAEEPAEVFDADNQEILERLDDLYTSLLTLIRERQAYPRRGLMWLKLALGDALLTADQQEGDVVLPVTVRPLHEGE
jgi:hypothetical protein